MVKKWTTLCRHNSTKHMQIRKGFIEPGKYPQHHTTYENTETPKREINVLYDHRRVKNSCFLAHKSVLVLITLALKIASLHRDLGMKLVFELYMLLVFAYHYNAQVRLYNKNQPNEVKKKYMKYTFLIQILTSYSVTILSHLHSVLTGFSQILLVLIKISSKCIQFCAINRLRPSKL